MATKSRTPKKSSIKKTAKKKASDGKSKRSTPVKTKPKSSSISTPSIEVGQKLRSFVLPSTGGSSIDVANLGGKNVVLYFYPKDDTPGCTLEGKDFTRLREQFRASNTEVYGISRDSLDSHEKFKNKYRYTIDLLSDQDEKLCRHFGVIKPKNMYGKTVIGVERSTFVFDAEGVLRREWRKVRVDGHADEVLEFVRSL